MLINLYYANFSSMDEEKLIEEYRNKVDRERWMKVMRTGADKARVRSLIAGYLLQQGVRDFLTEERIPFEDEAVLPFQYRYTQQGKPYLVNYPDLYFNLSHSGQVAACAVADCEIGIDIQAYVGGKERIAKRFFTKEEQELLEEAKKDGRFEELFFTFWSIKESYLKYTSLGMKQGLDSFRIDLKKHQITDLCDRDRKEEPVFFRQIELPGLSEYACSVCFKYQETEIAVKKIELEISEKNQSI
ncbi:MAG: 4'-phosphopantetheinyl transferase family protein [Suilimivivens sp.]